MRISKLGFSGFYLSECSLGDCKGSVLTIVQVREGRRRQPREHWLLGFIAYLLVRVTLMYLAHNDDEDSNYTHPSPYGGSLVPRRQASPFVKKPYSLITSRTVFQSTVLRPLGIICAPSNALAETQRINMQCYVSTLPPDASTTALTSSLMSGMALIISRPRMSLKSAKASDLPLSSWLRRMASSTNCRV